jgi:hypothetical protein
MSQAVITAEVDVIFKNAGSKPGQWIMENNKLCGNQRVDF